MSKWCVRTIHFTLLICLILNPKSNKSHCLRHITTLHKSSWQLFARTWTLLRGAITSSSMYLCFLIKHTSPFSYFQSYVTIKSYVISYIYHIFQYCNIEEIQPLKIPNKSHSLYMLHINAYSFSRSFDDLEYLLKTANMNFTL